MSGLDVVGAAFAVPGLIDVVVRGGVAVYERIETFRHTDEAIRRFRELAQDIREGPLFFGIHALEGTSKDRNVPTDIKVQLVKLLENLKKELDMSLEGLKAVREDTLKGKLVYTLWLGKGSEHQLKKLLLSLEGACEKLRSLCRDLGVFKLAPSSHLWTSDAFKLRHETPERRPGAQLPLSDIVVAAGNYHRMEARVEADFTLEEKTRENDVRHLCSVLSARTIGNVQGILPVLGYRQPPYNNVDDAKIFQLLIELPEHRRRESLAHRIASSTEPETSARLKICLQVAMGLAGVHSLNLLHKALRPRAILLLSDHRLQNSEVDVYLQDWTYIRELSGATTQLGEGSWRKAIYQHPERQGQFAEATYQPRHDIYSLGVTMLEVLLWKPFVVPTPNSQTDEPDRVCNLFESAGLQLGESNGGLPERYRGDTMKLTSRPWATNAIWCEITRSQLLEPDLQYLILACLDGRLQDVQEVVKTIEKSVAART